MMLIVDWLVIDGLNSNSNLGKKTYSSTSAFSPNLVFVRVTRDTDSGTDLFTIEMIDQFEF